VGIWVYAWASFFGQIPLYAIGCAMYVRVLFPSLSVTGFALAMVTFFYLVNLFGVRLAAQLQAVLVIILISALIYYAGAGIAVIKPENFSNFLQNGPTNLLLGTALLTFTYFGANGIIELGGEIVNPGKVIPAAFFIALPTVMLIYVAVAVATVGAVPAGLLGQTSEPLITVCRQTTGRAGMFFFTVGGAVLALTTTLNALFIVGTKSLLMMAADRLLPSKMGRLNQKFGTPHMLLTVIWIFSVAGIVSGVSLETLASYAALGGLIIFLPVQIAAMRLPVLYREQYQQSAFKLRGWQLWFCTLVGIAMVIFFSIVILADLKSVAKISWFAAFVLSGIGYYHLRKKNLAAKGIRIADLLKKKELHHG
jgi:APA family basic amino acid/polyamine antiporter